MAKYSISLMVLISLLSLAAGANIICSTTNFFWTEARVDFLSPNRVSFTISKGNGMGGDADIGKRAILVQSGVVHPNGQTFFHYHGRFEPGATSSAISFYLSEDHRTLTQILDHLPQVWSCK